MPKIDDSIEVQVPVEQAYNQWTQFEEFPKFMEGIQSVQQLDDTHVQWVAQIRGESRQWTTEITEQRPDERIAWKTIDGEVKNDGIVTFEQVGDGLTRINLEMDVEGESPLETGLLRSALGALRIAPRPTPHSLKNQRRVTALRCSAAKCSRCVITILW